MICKVHANQHAGWAWAGVSKPLKGSSTLTFHQLDDLHGQAGQREAPTGTLTFLEHLLPQLQPEIGILSVGQLLEDILYVQV